MLAGALLSTRLDYELALNNSEVRHYLHEMLASVSAPPNPKDKRLSRSTLSQVFSSYHIAIATNADLFSPFIQLCLMFKEGRLVEKAFRLRFDFEILVGFIDDVNSPLTVEWGILNNGLTIFRFKDRLIGNSLMMLANRWVEMAYMFKAAAQQKTFVGVITLNFEDCGDGHSLTFCETDVSRLIPDPGFWGTQGYQKIRDHFREQSTPWHLRSNRVFWRGSTTGIHFGNVLDLPRVRMCMLFREDTYFDLAITELVQMSPDEQKMVSSLNIIGDYVDWKDFGSYKYHIDIDGNTNSWPGLMYKLLSGGVVLKVGSDKDFKQWYYDRLIPWKNYVPVKSDLSNLREIVEALRNDDAGSSQIASAGQQLAFEMDHDSELASTLSKIAAFAANRIQS